MILCLNYLSMTLGIKLPEKILENLRFPQNLLIQDETQSILFQVDVTGGCVLSLCISLFLLPVLTIKAPPQRPHIRETQEGHAHGQIEDTRH